MNIEPIDQKYKAFGWNVIRIDGNNFEEIIKAFNEFKNQKEKPSVIIADTLAGKGVSCLEGKVKSHGKWITDKECERAIRDLS